jgi:6-phospho-beta-glucosidase
MAERGRRNPARAAREAPRTERAAIAILGGSSAFTPALAQELAAVQERLPPLDVRLQGRDRGRLAAVARFCQGLADAVGADHRYSSTLATGDAARGAALVINQMRVGGFAGRTHDETFPLAFDLPGDETIGPGGLASAIRSVPVVLAAARAVAAAADRPWFVNLTNPLGIVTRALLDEPGIRPFGLCELPGALLARVLMLVGARRSEVDVDYFGLNHQGWFPRIEQGGRDLLPAIFAAIERAPRDPMFPVDGESMRADGALPLPYLRLYRHRGREAAAMRARSTSRGEELAALLLQLHAAYAAWQPGAPAVLPAVLARRSVPWVREAVVPCLLALLGGETHELFVTMQNGGVQAGLAADAVVELRCRVDAAGAHPEPLRRPPPPHLLRFAQRIVEFEQKALAVSLRPSPERVLDALLPHPFDLDPATARALVAKVLQPV